MINRIRSFRGFRLLVAPVIAVVSFFLLAGDAGAFLHRVGPLNPAPSVGNFPAWYQDNTGITLEFCAPDADNTIIPATTEVTGGWCLLLPGDVTTPEVFPTNFFDEHFYYSAGVVIQGTDFPGTPLNRVVLVLAVESAFAAGPPIPGDQIVFARIRVDLRTNQGVFLVPGTYRFIHPYGEEVFVVADSVTDRIFITEDVGIACAPGDFTCALNSRLGPFLLPSATPGGVEMPPLTQLNPTPDTDPSHFGGTFTPTAYPGTGKSYIADPARIGPVTGSPTDNNFFRIEGPSGSNIGGTGIDFIQDNNFSLVGRIFPGNIPSEVKVDRAEYARNTGGQKVEVYATGFETAQARIPAQPQPAGILPVLSFFDAPCTDNNGGPPFGAPPQGANETQMFNAGNSFWAPVPVAAIPTGVCVKDSVSSAFYPKPVTDAIIITEAFFDNNAQSLSVKAFSSDETAPPVLTLGGFGDLTNGAILVSPLAAPPSHVHVVSSAGGSRTQEVSTTPSPNPPPPAKTVTLTASKPGSAFIGDNVAFSAAASGGSGNYEYQFMVKFADSGTFGVVRGYSTDNTWTWNTGGASATNYEVAAYARSVGSAAELEAFAALNYALTVQGTPVTTLSLTANPVDNTQTGGTATFTASALDGTGPFEYEFQAAFSGGTFGVVRGYTFDNTWVWDTTGAPATGYDIRANVRRAGQAVPDTTTTIPYLLTAVTAPTSVSLAATPVDNTQSGLPVTFEATVPDGTPPFEYEYLARFASGGAFGVVRGYTLDNTWVWDTTGATAAAYEIMVMVRRAGQSVPFDVMDVIPYTLTP